MSDQRALPYYPGLDGLRAFAVAGVLMFHAGFDWARGGHLGVSTFFTLSGFLITLLLIRERERTGRVRLARFWARRFRRLMPAALTGLGGVAVLASFVVDGDQLERLRGDGIAACLYVVNWWFIATEKTYADLFATPSPVQHYWSLSIEEQFYVAFPIVVAGVLKVTRGSRRTLAVVLAALAILSTAQMARLHQVGDDPSRVYYGTDTRAAELLVGALFALWMFRGGELRTPGTSRWGSVVGLTALVAMLASWVVAPTYAPWLFDGGYAVYALTTVLVIAAALGPGPLRTFLGLRPLRELGRISYGVYLYHWPIFLWLDPQRTGMDGLPLFAVRVAVTLAVSIASYRWIEQPIRYGGALTGGRAWAASGTAVATVVLALTLVTRNVPESPISFDTAADASRAVSPVPALSDAMQPRILTVGDSVAFNVGVGLEQWADRQGAAVVKNTWLSALGWCSIGRGGKYVDADGARFRSEKCDDWERRWGIAVATFHPTTVVVLTGFWDMLDREQAAWNGVRRLGDPEYDDWIVQEFVAAVDSLASRGAHVVWLTVPCIGPSPWGSPVRRTLDDPGFSTERVRHMNEVIIPRLARARPRTVTIVDLFAKVCPGGHFADSLDGTDGIRPDGLHFSKTGSEWVAEWLGPKLVTLAGGPPSAWPNVLTEER